MVVAVVGYFLFFETLSVNIVQKCQICVENEKPDWKQTNEMCSQKRHATLLIFHVGWWRIMMALVNQTKAYKFIVSSSFLMRRQM